MVTPEHIALCCDASVETLEGLPGLIYEGLAASFENVAVTIAALELVAIDYAGEVPSGDDPRSNAIRAVRAALTFVKGR